MKAWQFTTRWLLGSQVAARLLGLVNNVLLARLLAPASYGDFAQAMAFAGSLVPLADMGLSAVITRHIARRPRSHAVLSASLGLRLAQSLLLLFVVTLSAWLLYGSPRLRVAIVLAGVYWSLACIGQLLAGVARARLQAHVEAQAVILERTSAVLLAVVGAVWFGPAGALAGVIAGGALAVAYLLRRMALPRVRVHRVVSLRLIAIGAPLMAADLCHGLIMRLDLLAVGMRYGAQHAGWYGSASTLLWAAVLVPGSMALAIVPAFASERSEHAGQSNRVLGWMLAVSLLMAVTFSAGAKVWVGLLYGGEYAPAEAVLRVLAWCLVPASVVAWGNATLLVHHRTVWVGTVAIGGLACLAICLWWWLPGHGLLGAAWTQLVTQCLMAIALWWLVGVSASTRYQIETRT